MWGKFKKKQSSEPTKTEYPVKDISLFELRKAIQKYSSQLPDEVPLSILINDDLTIDYEALAPILKAIPKETYYMSKETYEVFEEKDYQKALDIDMIQQAVDKYIQQTDELPIIHGDPYKRVSYHKLDKLNLISHRPNREFFITDEEYLITTQKPS